MDLLLARISALITKNTPESADKLRRIGIILDEGAPIPGIIARLVATPKSEGGYDYVNPHITDANFPATSEPNLEGARLDEIVGSRKCVLSVLKSLGRRAATVSEGLFYGVKNPEDQRKYWIWALAQVWVFPSHRPEHALALCANDDGERGAYLMLIAGTVLPGGQILSFPMTPAELAARDAESAARRTV